jgi:hypothetical protein
MKQFDLNIQNYRIDELIYLFDLPPSFDIEILDSKERKLSEKLLNDATLSFEMRNTITDFLRNAKKEIIKNKKSIADGSAKLSSTKLDNLAGNHIIQQKDKDTYINSYPSEFFAGTLNPLKKRILHKNLNIDTRFRENYYTTLSTNVHINLPVHFNDVIKMQLTSIEMPITCFVISKKLGNHFFTIKVNSEQAIIDIPNGNYNEISIVNIINAQLVSKGGVFALVSFTTNLRSGTGTGQMVVAPNAPGVDSIELNFQNDIYGNEDINTPLPLKLGWFLGFRSGKYTGNINYVSEGIPDLTGPKYIYLVVDDFNNNVNNGFFNAFNSSILNKNILARISLQSQTFQILLQNNLNLTTAPREYFGPVNIKNLHIQLLDEYGRVLDLNSMDYSFCLTLTTIYDI